MNEDNEEYKSLLIVNETNDAKVTLYIYPTWLPISFTSKILQPNEKYLHRDKTAFRYKLVANFDDKREKKEFPGPLELIRDILIRVTESLECVEENLADYPQEKRICLRKMHFTNEHTSTSGKVNLYGILGLDMTEVRKLNIGDQKIAIKKAFRDKIRIWHPDKNFGDVEIAMQIILARETLLDDERRACYHNEADYDEGWFSLKRYKAIFWPDCYTEKQNKAYWRRIGMMAGSLGLAIGGIILTALTAGAAAPAVVVCGTVFEGGFTGAGILSGKHTISKHSVVHGCEPKSWLLRAGIGFLAGAATGGAVAAIPAGGAAIESVILESNAVTSGQLFRLLGKLFGTSAIKRAGSIASEAAANLVDNESAIQSEKIGCEERALFRYKSEGAWISKMIVTYLLDGKQIEEEVSGSGGRVKIPLDARRVKVKFQVRRPAWGDIMKYDRFKKTWCKPYEPHVFCYKKPPTERTFTISGNLWWEAVMRVSDEYHEETGEMC